MVTDFELECLRDELKEATKTAKQLIEINSLNHSRFMAMRARLAVLTVLHRDELEKMGFNINRWIKELELDQKQLSGLVLSLKRKYKDDVLQPQFEKVSVRSKIMRYLRI